LDVDPDEGVKKGSHYFLTDLQEGEVVMRAGMICIFQKTGKNDPSTYLIIEII